MSDAPPLEVPWKHIYRNEGNTWFHYSLVSKDELDAVPKILQTALEGDVISIRLFPEFRDEVAKEINELRSDCEAQEDVEARVEMIECFDPRDGQRKYSDNPALMLAEIMTRSGRVLDDVANERMGQLASYCESDIAKAKGVQPYDGSGYLLVPITAGDFQALLEPEKR